MESKGLCLDRVQAGGLWVVMVGALRPHRRISVRLKSPLINLTYVPKLHILRMIPIRLKPNAVQE